LPRIKSPKRVFFEELTYAGATVLGDLDFLGIPELERTLLLKHQSITREIIAELRGGHKYLNIDIRFEHVDDNILDGIAFVRDNVGYLGLHSGTVLIAYDTFYRMMSHPDFLPHIGDPRRESIRDFHSHGLSDDYAEILGRRSDPALGLAGVRPKDEVRAKFAEYLAILLINTVTFHEIGHIRFGHCEYGDEVLRLKHLTRRNLTGKDVGGITCQALESHADSFAILHGVSLHMNVKGTTPDYYRIRETQETLASTQVPPYVILQGFEFGLSDWILSYHIKTWIYGYFVDLNRIAIHAHPPSVDRFVMCSIIENLMIDKLSLIPQDAKRSFKIAFESASYRASIAQILVSGGIEDPDTESFATLEANNILNAHQIAVFNEFLRIKPDVEKYEHWG
jgi:hypothetical protein